MVRPNQIIDATTESFTFIMFARNESTVKRRVLILNFPSVFIPKTLIREDLDKYINSVEIMTEGEIKRYAVEVDITNL